VGKSDILFIFFKKKKMKREEGEEGGVRRKEAGRGRRARGAGPLRPCLLQKILNCRIKFLNICMKH
jgi:hypothetical protein